MDHSKRIIISGYYGFDNTGDEAVLYSIIQALYKECKQHDLDITVLSNQPEQTKKIYGVNAIDRWNIKEIWGHIKKCDLLISGGGSLLQDVTSNKTVPYYLLILKMAQWHKKEVVFYSQGFGPVNKWHNKFLVRRVLSQVRYIFVRDQESKRALEMVGLKKSPVMVTADPVLGMETKQETELKMKAYIDSYSQGKSRVGIYLRSWKNDQRLIGEIAQLCKLLAQEGFDIFFIPMQQPDDVEFMQKINLPHLPVHKLTDALTIQEVLSVTGQMDLVIGMRLHALIMATAQGIPVAALSYDPKVDNFMESIHNKHCFDVEAFHAEDVMASIKNQIGQDNKQNILDKKQLLLDRVYEPANLINKILT